MLLWTSGAVLDELTFDGPFQGGQAHRCNELFARIRAVYEERGTTSRLQNLHVKMYTHRGQFSCLTAKAAESRALIPVLLQICKEEGVDSRSERDTHRILMLQYLDRVIRIIMEGDLVLSDAEADAALEAYEDFLQHYHVLARWSIEKGVRNYNFVFKHHHLWHIIDHCRAINAKYIWAYEFEDLFLHFSYEKIFTS